MSTIVRFTIDGDEERSYTLVDAPNPPVTGDRVEHGGTTYMVDSSIMSTLAGQDPDVGREDDDWRRAGPRR